jgi:hypothetical protein
MSTLWILAVPALLGAAALKTGFLPFKLGVPLGSAIIIGVFVLPTGVGVSVAGWVIVALFASAVGDFFLSNRRSRDTWFIAGIAFFLLAHGGYLAAILAESSVNLPVLAAMLIGFGLYYLVLLRPRIASLPLSISVLLYLVVSCLVFSVAVDLEWSAASHALYATGIALIVISDTAISAKEFLRRRGASWIILPTYYLAHLSITAALLLR